ncbi:hypothetical protein [Laspinema olomoucense]|uniref:hypothetical protein n=1 Tax=Laspinema olomoucense TaxID=3231600 RepID=UPI0021BA8BD5|nr:MULTISPECIES: hypothetical protein [unclassified Laspinema]MCT7990341.1 hypothetical protein [Laspinema sp. D3a]MCT7994949.1 hypothetical protein [Laspinema sp. D3c]
MSKNIRLFSNYIQRENQTTNYCLLILKLLYEENPKFLSEVLSTLLGERLSGAVGVKFSQQNRGKKSVPDGTISQEAFLIVIETKRDNRFNLEQLSRHLESMKEQPAIKVLMALGNFEWEEPNPEAFQDIDRLAEEMGVAFAPVSFEQFLQALKLSYLPKNLVDAIADLEEYMNEENLLPSWKYHLDVVNCRVSFDDVLQHQIYVCPATDGSYNHRRSLYFGMYRNKRVEQIGKIEAVVDLESEETSSIKWKKNIDKPDLELVETARSRRSQIDDSWYPARVFILADLHPTDFVKASPGGMQSSKQYFDISHLNVIDAEDLARKLMGKTWENY